MVGKVLFFIELIFIIGLVGTVFFLGPFTVSFFVEHSPYDIELIFLNFFFAVLSSLVCCLIFSVLFGFSLFMTIGAGVLILLLFAMALMPGAEVDGGKSSVSEFFTPSYTKDDGKNLNFFQQPSLNKIITLGRKNMFDLSGFDSNTMNKIKKILSSSSNSYTPEKLVSGSLFRSLAVKVFWFLIIIFFWGYFLYMGMDLNYYYKLYSFSENVKCSLDWPFFCALISVFLLCGAVIVIDVCGVCSGALVGGSWKSKIV